MPRLLVHRLLWVVGALAAAIAISVIATTVVFAESSLLSAPDASEQNAAGELILLDIRTPDEWEKSGVARGAWPVSMHTPDFPKQLQDILAQNPAKQVGLICATGGRSAYVTDILARNGVTGVSDVSEGMYGNGQAPGWIARGLPTVTKAQALADFKAVKDSWQ